MTDETGRDQAPAPPTQESGQDAGAMRPVPAYSVIQQQLIDARDRLDREVTRLKRMHAFNARALRLTNDAEFIPAVAEAIVDIFEVEFGICWPLDDAGAVGEPIGVLGIQVDNEQLRETGQRLASFLMSTPSTPATALTAEILAHIASGMSIGQAIGAPCLDADGKTRMLLMGGNTTVGARFFESVTTDLAEVFGLFAQQLAALIRNRHERTVIEQQVAEIQRANQRLTMAVEVTQLVFWEVDFVSNRLHFDQAMLPTLGLAADERLDTLQDWTDSIHPDDRGPFAQRVERAVKALDPAFDFEYRLAGKSGEHQWIHSKGRIVQRDAAGQPILAVGTSTNITDRKRAEAELEQHRRHLEDLVRQRTAELVKTEARASHILASSADGLYGVDKNGRITFINRAACALLGYQPDQVIGRGAHDLFHHRRPDGTAYPAAECPSHRALGLGETIRVDDEVHSRRR